jgi:secretion/DNA translocation related TadE-like protein
MRISPLAADRGHRGAGTMLVAGIVLVLAVVALVGVAAGGYDTAQRATSGAADLVALSAATAYRDGGDACAAARSIAADNGVELSGCTTAGDSFDYAVSVTVRRHVTVVALWSLDITGTAVAGHLQPVG